MLYPLIAIIVGFFLLMWGADRFVAGAAGLARALGVAPLLIGLTVVGFGTSAPEILVSVTAALQGNGEIALGNAVGSNIANIGLILGVTALVAPLMVHSNILRGEYPILLIASIGTYFLLFDGNLSRIDGMLLLAGLIVAMTLIVRMGIKRPQDDPMIAEYEAEIPDDMSKGTALGLFALGLVVLIVSSKILVWGAVEVATALGVSELVIGLTIVAIGTSLPELAASVMSALKNEHDIAIGNIIGSNLYNLLAVLCVPGLLAPSAVPEVLLNRDMLVMLALTLALLVMGMSRKGQGQINRFEGAILLLAFVGYQGWLFVSATSSGNLS